MPVLQRIAVLLALLAVCAPAPAQNPDWPRPFPGHRVIGNLYAVGTYDLGCYLVTSSEGHFLINTGIEGSVKLIEDNMQSLGFRLEDVKALLTMQAHWDHTAGLAEIKQRTGAKMYATAGDKPLLEDGGFSDPRFGGKVSFPPVKVDRVLQDGETLTLGEARLTVVETKGHTPGSVSYTMRVREGGATTRWPLQHGLHQSRRAHAGAPDVPGHQRGLRRDVPQAEGHEGDVWVSGHGSQYGLHQKYKPGQAYGSADVRGSQGLSGGGRALRAGLSGSVGGRAALTAPSAWRLKIRQPEVDRDQEVRTEAADDARSFDRG